MVSPRSFGYALRQILNFSSLKTGKTFAIIPVVLAVAVACGCGGSSYSSVLQGASTGALQITPNSVHLVAKSVQEPTAVPISIRNTSSHTVLVTSLVAQPYGMFNVMGQRAFLLNPNQVQQLTVVFTPGWLGTASSQKLQPSSFALPIFACCQGTLTITTPGAVTQVGLQGEVNNAQTSQASPKTNTIVISPSNTTVQSGQSLQFTATSNGHHIPVIWSASLGSINSNGFYIAPSVSSATLDTVYATSATWAAGFAIATVDVTSEPGPQPPPPQPPPPQPPPPPPSPQPPPPQPPPPQPPPSYSGSGYYMSPSGDDSNSGTASQPWKTFAYAISHLKPGDNLVLEDGLYRGANSGYPYVNCSSGAANGTAAAPIIIRGQNERAAFIQGDGTAYPVAILNCQYWQLIGLHVENGDFNNRNYNGTSTTEALYGDAIFLYNDSHLTLQRNLLARNNRYANSHLVDNYYTTHSLYEENEFYYFHRHGILDMYGAYNIFRRNYFNSRGYVDLPDGRYSSNPTRGDGGIVLYPAHDEIVENNISEGQHSASEIQCAFAANFCDNDHFLGNISLGDEYGHVFKARDIGDAYMPHNEYAENDVVLNPGLVGFYVRAVKNPSQPNCSGCTILGNKSTIAGVIADAGGSGETGDGTYQVWFRNVVSSFNQGSPGYGFQINTSYGTWTWTLDHTVAYSNPINYLPGIPNPNIVAGMTFSPQLGACKVWVPQGSPLSGAGTGGSDIGANVLYRYTNGSLTTQPLWDASTGQFPHGALVHGLNDVAGQSAFDVNVRLNVNSGGCSFPSNYP